MKRAATTLWARVITDELARCGVREVVVAPGSRSTPLVLALAAHGGFTLRVHLDERSAGFFALGVGKRTRRPGAVLTTSGTATANLLPAVVEASASETPLLVLTADRPPRLRGADANQAIDQDRLYGGYVRAFFDTAHPELDGDAATHLRSSVCRAVAACVGPSAGPVHVNVPFDKPLEPSPGTDAALQAFAREHPAAWGGRAEGRPWVEIARESEVLGDVPPGLPGALDAVRPGVRGVVVVGPARDPGRVGPAAVRAARSLGWPLLADPLSGARWTPGASEVAVAHYDALVREGGAGDALGADFVLRVGASPTSAALLGWLARRCGPSSRTGDGGVVRDPVVPHVVVDDGPRWKDHANLATGYVVGDAAALLDALADRGTEEAGSAGAADWLGAWMRAGARAAEALAALAAADSGPEGNRDDADSDEGRIAGNVVAALPEGATLFVSSSMPIRDVDARGAPRDTALHVLGNRGASGIDGIVSTAFGVADGGPAVCLLGDLAFFHDQNGLLFAREADRPVVFVLVDNDGGGIFHMLPVADHEPHFTRFFATPHGLDLAHAARLHGIPFEDAGVGDVAAALTRALAAGRTAVVRVRTDRDRATAARARALEAVAAATRERG